MSIRNYLTNDHVSNFKHSKISSVRGDNSMKIWLSESGL